MSEYIFYKHDGCEKLHFNLGEVRRCAGHWIHFEDLTKLVLVEKGTGNEGHRNS